MKKFTRLLLINWHYYSVEMIEFDEFGVRRQLLYLVSRSSNKNCT